MIRILPLGPGSAVPAWLEGLEEACFHQAWGPVAEHEYLWVADGLGFARWSAHPALDEAELLRIAVAPGARRSGVGRALLRASVKAFKAQGIRECHLEVRVSNLAARALYESEGWRLRGGRKAYYRDGEDAALYHLEMP